MSAPAGQEEHLRPDPILTVGVAGPVGFDGSCEPRAGLGRDADRLLRELLAECGRIAGETPDLFSGAPPRIRVVTRLAGASDVHLASAARAAGAELGLVLPDGPERPAGDRLDAAARAFLDESVASSPEPFALGREPGSAAALERAAAVLLDRSDILVAAWDGSPDRGRGGIAWLVQAAMDRRMPVLLLPAEGGGAVTVIDDPDEMLLPAVAADLPRVVFDDNRDRVLARAFAPPASPYERHALRDFLGEPGARRSRRMEYRLLLTLAGNGAARGPEMTGDEEWRRAAALATLVSPDAARAIALVRARQARMDDLAAFYGQRARSGIVLGYVLTTLGSLLVATFTLVAPQFGLSWLVVQAVVTALTIGEATYASRRRWNERWLDYRSLAERLRCDRFLLPLGLSTLRLDGGTGAEDPAWMRWWYGRLQRSLWVGGAIRPAFAEAALDHLVSVEIASQISYHEAAARRYRSIGRRLRLLGSGAVGCTLAATLLLLALGTGDGRPLSLQALLTVALITLPAVFLATRGLRVESRFELAAARSEQALAALREVARRVAAGPPSFDRLRQAARAAASAMIGDTVDWRIGVQRSRSPYRPARTAGAAAPGRQAAAPGEPASPAPASADRGGRPFSG